MKHSWTGGQYSVWRAFLALSLAPSFLVLLEHWSLRVPALALCLALALGLRDRLVALVLALGWLVILRDDLASPAAWSVAGVLALHATTHGSPYGSLDARGRSDPGGNWILPRWNFASRRLLFLAAIVTSLVRGGAELPRMPAVALWLSCCDPGWIPPLSAAPATRVFYDGGCGLCHRLVRMLLAEDRGGRAFRFSPLQGETFRETFGEELRASLPDSVVVRTDGGETLIRSRGSLHLFARLGGLWRAIAAVARLAPAPWLDSAYDGIAKVRSRTFAKPASACPIVPAHLSARFDP